MKEYSLVILKPDCLKRNLKNEIIKKILELWVEIIANKKLIAREEDLTIHYGDIGGLKEKLNPLKFSQIIEFMKSWEIEIFVLKWNLWMISSIRKKIWSTEPFSANPWTIRGDYSYDSYELSELENRSLHNLIHASANKEEALKEIKLWFPRLNYNFLK